MRKYSKPFIQDECIEIEDICENSNFELTEKEEAEE